MAWRKIGALLLGYSPRPGIVDDILSLRPQTDIIQVGALDGINFGDVASLRPRTEYLSADTEEDYPIGHYPLATMLNPNQPVSVERDDLLPLLQKKIGELEKTDVDAILLICTGDFPGLVSIKPLIIPHRVFSTFISCVPPKGRVAILCPIVGQKPACEAKWRIEGLNPIVIVTSLSSQADIQRTGYLLQHEEIDMVILDCYAFGKAAKEEMMRFVSCPVLSIRTIVVSILSEFLG